MALLNRARGETGWDAFVNAAVAAHYGLPLEAIAPPPGRLPAEREGRRKAKETEKSAKKGGKGTNGKKAGKKTTEPAAK